MHDILFRISDRFAIHSYGAMAMIGFLAALLVARRRALRAGLAPDEITDIGIWTLLAGIVGSRIAYVLLPENRGYFFDTRRVGWSLFDLIKIWEGGLVFYGGLIGAMIVTLLLLRAKKLKILPVLDVFAPSLALGQAFGRIGCCLHGCCYGAPVHAGAWYGCVFPANSVPYDPRAVIPIPPGAPLWPTQLVSSFDLFCIFIILSLFFRHQRRSGEVLSLYLILCSVERFTVEFFRGDTHLPGQMSQAQWISIGIFIAGVALMTCLKTSAPEKVPSRQSAECRMQNGSRK
jgi:phosphatidylglycerol:prolipoprotein diacylglycerol transferase